jgi:uncharacterized protein YqcC (DUF446 family)
MAAKYEYQQHPHAEARQAKGPAVSVKHDTNKAKLSLNDRIGLRITKSIGTMWAAYAFVGLTLVSLPAALASGNTLVIVAWIAQTFLQLVLLPVIIVGQNIQAASADAMAVATYEDATAVLEEAKQIQHHLAAQDEALDKLIKDLARVERQLKK